MTDSSQRRYLKDPREHDSAAERPRPMPASPEPPESPCVGVCTMDDEGHCLGCHRTLTEIAQWSTLSPEEQWSIVDALPARAESGG